MKCSFLLFSLLCTLITKAQTDKIELVNEPVFQIGEHIKYKIFYNWKNIWLGAGYVDFDVSESIIDNKPYYHITALGQTLKGFNLFYKVEDIYESHIDKKTLLPRRFIRDISEGGYKIDHQRDFFHEERKVISKTEDFKTPKRYDTLSLPPNAQDLLSAVYLTRCANYSNYKIGDIFPLTIFLDNTIQKLGVKYLGKEQVLTPLGTFNCIKAQPQVLKGRIFDEDDLDKVFIYVTDDMNRIPILIEAPIQVGSIKALLINYDGLKAPFNAKVK